MAAWFNPSPNWGQLDSSEDDPQMLLDDTDGAGPEIIALPLPEDDTLYRVGVHYWNDHDFGRARSRADLGRGQLAAEFPAATSLGSAWRRVTSGASRRSIGRRARSPCSQMTRGESSIIWRTLRRRAQTPPPRFKPSRGGQFLDVGQGVILRDAGLPSIDARHGRRRLARLRGRGRRIRGA